MLIENLNHTVGNDINFVFSKISVTALANKLKQKCKQTDL